MFPHDLRTFLEDRGIELRITPYGSGPRYWTIDNAALAIAEQEGWHAGSLDTLRAQMMDAAKSRALPVLDPQTCLPKLAGEVHQFYELVTPDAVNAWLEKQGSEYSWKVPSDDGLTTEYQDQYARAWEDLEEKDRVERELRTWESVGAITVTELQAKEAKLSELRARLAELDAAIFRSEVPQAAAPKRAGAVSEVDYSVLASRDQLIAAFGAFTGMDIDWFKNLDDTPALKSARKVTGRGQRGSTVEPLFCPFEVMQWLVNPKRKKGRPLGEDTGWRLLKSHFPKAYAPRESADPN